MAKTVGSGYRQSKKKKTEERKTKKRAIKERERERERIMSLPNRYCHKDRPSDSIVDMFVQYKQKTRYTATLKSTKDQK